MKTFLGLLLCLFVMSGQAQQLEWVRQFGGLGDDSCTHVELAPNGDVFVAGSFSETMQVQTIAGLVTLQSAGLCDIFLSRIQADGDIVWCKSLGSSGYDSPTWLHVDNNSNIILYGMFAGDVDFDMGTGSSISNVNMFAIAKYDESGNFLWTKILASDNAYPYGIIKTDNSNNIFIGGGFSGATDFDPGIGVDIQASSGEGGAFVSKFDENGNYIWTRSFIGIYNYELAVVNGIAFDDNNNIYLSGVFSGNLDADPGAGVYDLSSGSYISGMIIKLSSNGSYKFSYAIGSSGTDMQHCHSIFSYGNHVYIMGSFIHTVNFGLGQTTALLTSYGGHDGFILEMDTTGAFQSVRNHDFGEIQKTSFNFKNFTISGGFDGIIDPDNSDGVFQYINTYGNSDACVFRFDTLGNSVWYTRIGGSGYDNIVSSLSDNQQSVYGAGYFGSTVDFETGAPQYLLTAQGVQDGFVVKFNTKPTALAEHKFTSLSCYPNPTTGQIFFSTSTEPVHAEIFSTNGMLLISKTVTDDGIDISHLAPGVYFVKAVNTMTGETQISRLLKN
jgi:hypothetical protein